jgi:hypothetical protein
LNTQRKRNDTIDALIQAVYDESAPFAEGFAEQRDEKVIIGFLLRQNRPYIVRFTKLWNPELFMEVNLRTMLDHSGSRRQNKNTNSPLGEFGNLCEDSEQMIKIAPKGFFETLTSLRYDFLIKPRVN